MAKRAQGGRKGRGRRREGGGRLERRPQEGQHRRASLASRHRHTHARTYARTHAQGAARLSARTASGLTAFDDINLEKKGAYKDCATPFCSAYTQSKLANVLFAKELARRVPAGLEVRAAAAV